jgi:hypothetical protein
MGQPVVNWLLGRSLNCWAEPLLEGLNFPLGGLKVLVRVLVLELLLASFALEQVWALLSSWASSFS